MKTQTIENCMFSGIKTWGTLLVFMIFAIQSGISQNMSISASGDAPYPKAMLDVVSTDKGFLMPRVTKAQRDLILSGSVPAGEGMLIYQTDNTPGFYYFNGTGWVALLSGSGSGWQLTGNGAINPATNFIGTTDGQPFIIKTNGAERSRILSTGEFGIGTSTPTAGTALNVEGSSIFNDLGADKDFRIEGDNEPNLFFLDAGNDRIGIGASAPSSRLHVYQSGDVSKSVLFSNAKQASVATNYENIAIYGLGKGGNASFGYSIGTIGVGDQANSNLAVGLYGVLGTAAPALATTNMKDAALFADGATIGLAGYFRRGRVCIQEADAALLSPSATFAVNGIGNTNVSIFGAATSIGTNNTGAVVGSAANTISGTAVLGGLVFTFTPGLTQRLLGSYGRTGDGDSENRGVQGEYGSGSVNPWGFIGGVDCGVLGSQEASGTYGVRCQGNFVASGTKSFEIDHPLDPENKFLKHFCIESNEVLNLYRGTVTLDGSGAATVTLPNYFNAININFSYNLTAVGSAAPDLHINKEISSEGTFSIAGGKPGMKVSWVIYGERNDKYMQANPESKQVEVAKKDNQKGKYTSPGAYKMPSSKGIYQR